MQVFVITNIFGSIFFTHSIQFLYGSILVYQIMAHMPLANISLPANSIQVFEILISVVSYDYYQLFDHWDVGFTPTDPFSINFEVLGYGSLNFLEGLGSINFMLFAL